MSLAERIKEKFIGISFKLEQVYNAFPDEKQTTIRGRIYDNLDKRFEKIARGLYRVKNSDNYCLVLEGDGRSLENIDNESIDTIITDHPWKDLKSNKGGNRNFANYETFNYTIKDFNEKYRVLKNGAFLIEFIPAENETNFNWLYELKTIAIKAGFQYYAKITWKKGKFISNTGRKSKNTEDVMIFSKGKARSLRLDAKKTKKFGIDHYMSGTNKMLPCSFEINEYKTISNEIDVSPTKTQGEKPVELLKQLIDFVTKENEIILDQFAGSGSTGEAALLTNRNCILIEKCKDKVDNILKRLDNYENVLSAI